MQLGDEVISFCFVSQCFCRVAGKLDAGMPYPVLGYASAGKLYDNIHRIGPCDIAGKEGSHTVRIQDASCALLVDLNSLVNVETVGIHHLLGCRVYAKFLVFCYDLLCLLELVPAVYA